MNNCAISAPRLLMNQPQKPLSDTAAGVLPTTAM